jgi:hypothetical protein
LTRIVLSFFTSFSLTIHILPLEIYLLKLFNSFIIFTLINYIIIIQHTLIILVSLHFGIWEIKLSIKTIIDILLVFNVLNLSSFCLPCGFFCYFWFCWGLTELLILHSHICLIKMRRRYFVIKIEKLSFYCLLITPLRFKYLDFCIITYESIGNHSVVYSN